MFRTFLAAALVAALGLAGLSVQGALAATATPTIATPGVQVIPLHIAGQQTADVAAAIRLKLPFKAKLLGVSASARASGGTDPTLAVDIQAAGTTVLSAPIAVTAGAVAEGTLATTTIADETVITVDLDLGGTSPTWDDITVLLTVVRL